ncbi:MAG: PaaI family thioesterase [Bowdeniella nasicola]|nr:PaaI family thioesterase [Bowdeniella nasicola]
MSLTSPSLDALGDNPLGALGARLNIRLASTAIDGYPVLVMPVVGNTQPFGYLHGGASAVLVETAASLAALTDFPDSLPIGSSLGIHHLAPVRSGEVETRTRCIDQRSSRALYEVNVRHDGQLIASGRLTVVIKPRG